MAQRQWSMTRSCAVSLCGLRRPGTSTSTCCPSGALECCSGAARVGAASRGSTHSALVRRATAARGDLAGHSSMRFPWPATKTRSPSTIPQNHAAVWRATAACDAWACCISMQHPGLPGGHAVFCRP
eukprot:365697-Chlamydomonas_euryale.AAC.3